ncbi:MAG: exodeoxyribonuclease III [Nanobdellota archaeon]
MDFVSWNVNGIRAAIKNGFKEKIESLSPDILCLQEIKTQKQELALNGYVSYWNFAEKKGYSSTAVFTRLNPLKVSYNFNGDIEGRVMTLEFNDFYLINVYTPNSKRDLSRLHYRKDWDYKFREYVNELDKSKPVLVCGDLNVAHQEIDIANPSGNKTTKSKPGNAGFTDQEREYFTRFLDSGFVDTFRYFYPDWVKYSWWTYMFNARAKNKGWRLDYFCASERLKSNLKDAGILNEVYGSDHCPVTLKVDF